MALPVELQAELAAKTAAGSGEMRWREFEARLSGRGYFSLHTRDVPAAY
jgi:hypothetical protein